ncbi:hypothetical protein AB0K18_36890 [Nonomuraea sp. NPDC049421]|uniref:hypothetical protein n=1 Tax=Nonomuraea sp. NPDC049421 TaxID=3155275 RepID=UPI0034289081
MSGRRRLLADLVELRRPVDEVVGALRSFPWDVERPLVRVRAEDVVRLLRAYLAGAVTADTVTAWADALEIRDDVDIDEGLRDFFTEASAPELFEPVPAPLP